MPRFMLRRSAVTVTADLTAARKNTVAAVVTAVPMLARSFVCLFVDVKSADGIGHFQFSIENGVRSGVGLRVKLRY